MIYKIKPHCGLKALVVQLGLFLFFSLPAVKIAAQNPVADFTSNLTTGCIPLSVNFTNLSAQSNSYFWDFGNGNTSTLTNPTTVYTSAGFYTVTLVAINTMTGNRDTMVAVNYIFIEVEADPDFTAQPLSGCAVSQSFQFTNLSQNAVSYAWDFGDGTFSSDVNPVHTYALPGTYTVKLIATNAEGCTKVKTQTNYITVHPNPVASFTVNQQSSCDPNQIFTFNATGSGVTSWQWDFGDGTTSNIASPTHTYNAQGSFNVTLVVTNQFGCTDTAYHNAFINIGATLVPTFTVNSQTGCPPFIASFNSTVANGTGWLWDFGDGNTSTLESPQHTYSAPGVYTVTLTATTTSGCNGTATFPGHITVDNLPVLSFAVADTGGCSPFSTTMINNSSGAATYLWDFGDGTTSTSLSPSVTYTTAGTYNITLTGTTTNGCTVTDTLTAAVTVYDITAGFTATPRTGCAPLPVDFSGSATPAAAAWQWTFGDGNTGTGQNPTNIYNAIGNYSITLVVTSPQGCTDTITRNNYVKVLEDSVPYTVPDTIKVCLPPGSVSFTDPTVGSNWWLWDFGDGDTSGVKNPSHNYQAPGIYVVTLQTAMAGGCTQTFNPYAIVEVLPFVVSPIISVITSVCNPFTVALDNTTPDVASYLWDFGDGDTSTLQNPTHTYAQAGTYTITLLLTAINGCQTSLSATVTFGHSMPITLSSADICLGDSIQFGLNPQIAFVAASWDFGDGDTSNLLTPSHLYSQVGSYNVSVTVTDTSGCIYAFSNPVPVLVSDPIPSFVVNQATTGCVNFNVTFTNTSVNASSYLWDFGDGNTSTDVNPLHSYTAAGTYTVSLTATENGCSRTYTVPNLITANQAVADFSFTPNTGCLPLTVTFTDLSVNPVSWKWTFGDGDSSIVQHPVHIYTTVPTGNVRLEITDINGCKRARNRAVPIPVIPIILVNDSSGCRPLLIQFSTPTPAVSYFWDFGDGDTSNQQNPSHLYQQAGLYTVTLTCILASGCSAVTVWPDFIEVNAPASDFMSPTVSVCAPSLVNFVNQSSGATSWLWNFGDGTTSTLENPSHIYHMPGTYTVTLISYSAAGCADTMIKVDYIVIPGTYTSFTLGSQINCANTLVQFLDQSVNATSWFWNFGDGYTSTLQNPTHLYGDTGSFIVTLIASDSTGCSSFFSSPNPIVIHPVPVVNATIPVTEGCEPLTASFVNQSSGGDSYLWNFGNGDTSSQLNATYTYTSAGIYSPTLVAYTNMGCSDTISFPSAITVHETPVSAFAPSVISGCNPLPVTFNNSSQQLNNAVWSWSFGNGNTNTQQQPTHLYSQTGIYQVQLIVVNTGGCSDTAMASIEVFDTPVAAGQVLQYNGCAPHAVQFINTSTGADFIEWHFGDGATSALDTADHLYSNPGTYQPYLVAGTNSGCYDTLYFQTPVTIYPVPNAAFTVNQNAGCSGSSFQLNNLSVTLPGSSWQWNIGGITSTIENPSVQLQSPGFYNVSLIVTNQHGCTDTLSEPNFIEVYDTLPPPVCPILSVSVLNNSSVEIVWENSPVTDLYAYVLYRLNTTNGQFVEIYRDTALLSAPPMNLTSNYTDTGLNTLSNVYTYKLQAIDRCAYTLPLSALTAHTTINITATAITDDIRVTWTPYGGCTVDTYELSRVSLQTGQVALVASLPGNILEYLDLDFDCPHEYSYRVMATGLCGNPYTSLSDTANAIPENVLAGQKVDVVRSTVVNDSEVLTEWLPPQLAPHRVKEYRVMRSVDRSNYTYVATVVAPNTSFVDSDVDVHSGEYYYKVDVVSDCEITGTISNMSSSIWLQGKSKDDKTRLWWTPYREWNTGVDYYIIERLNLNGQWERVRTVSGSEIETTLDE